MLGHLADRRAEPAELPLDLAGPDVAEVPPQGRLHVRGLELGEVRVIGQLPGPGQLAGAGRRDPALRQVARRSGRSPRARGARASRPRPSGPGSKARTAPGPTIRRPCPPRPTISFWSGSPISCQTFRTYRPSGTFSSRNRPCREQTWTHGVGLTTTKPRIWLWMSHARCMTPGRSGVNSTKFPGAIDWLNANARRHHVDVVRLAILVAEPHPLPQDDRLNPRGELQALLIHQRDLAAIRGGRLRGTGPIPGVGRHQVDHRRTHRRRADLRHPDGARDLRPGGRVRVRYPSRETCLAPQADRQQPQQGRRHRRRRFVFASLRIAALSGQDAIRRNCLHCSAGLQLRFSLNAKGLYSCGGVTVNVVDKDDTPIPVVSRRNIVEGSVEAASSSLGGRVLSVGQSILAVA